MTQKFMQCTSKVLYIFKQYTFNNINFKVVYFRVSAWSLKINID